jgi:hypothetical protein
MLLSLRPPPPKPSPASRGGLQGGARRIETTRSSSACGGPGWGRYGAGLAVHVGGAAAVGQCCSLLSLRPPPLPSALLSLSKGLPRKRRRASRWSPAHRRHPLVSLLRLRGRAGVGAVRSGVGGARGRSSRGRAWCCSLLSLRPPLPNALLSLSKGLPRKRRKASRRRTAVRRPPACLHPPPQAERASRRSPAHRGRPLVSLLRLRGRAGVAVRVGGAAAVAIALPASPVQSAD